MQESESFHFGGSLVMLMQNLFTPSSFTFRHLCHVGFSLTAMLTRMRSRNYCSSGNKFASQIICISTSSEFPLHFFQITETSEKTCQKIDRLRC